MTRELRRLLIDPSRLASQITLQPEEAHYVSRVLRCRHGDRLEVVDGCGRLWTACLTSLGLLQLEQPLEVPSQRSQPPRPALALAMAVPRRDADLAWRMATELGVDQLIPLRADRTVAGDRLPIERWRSIIREATEQCERLWLPSLEAAQGSDGLLADPAAALALLAITRRPGVLPLAELLAGSSVPAPESGPSPWPRRVLIAVGPEGGWSPREEARALAGGWIPVSLGTSILRTATAAVAAIAQLASWRALSCGSCSPPSP